MRESALERNCRIITRGMGGRLWKWTGQIGVPDRICMMPDGGVYFLEFKQKGKKPRASQKAVHQIMNALGHEVHVIDSVEKFLEVVENRHMKKV